MRSNVSTLWKQFGPLAKMISDNVLSASSNTGWRTPYIWKYYIHFDIPLVTFSLWLLCQAVMSSGCPPQSPAVAKTDVTVEGECPLLAATFAYWDNILGPRVRHIWVPRCEQSLFLRDGEVTFLANHTLNGEILRSAECGAVDVKFFVLAEKGVIIVSLIFDGELKGDKNTCALSIILPQTELGFYLPLHTVCVERLKHIIRKGRIWMQKVDALKNSFLTGLSSWAEISVCWNYT